MLSLLTLLPPDRVGIVRKLRLGHTLVRRASADGGGWRLDLSKQRDGHKTSRFYGAFCSKLHLTYDASELADAIEKPKADLVPSKKRVRASRFSSEAAVFLAEKAVEWRVADRNKRPMIEHSVLEHAQSAFPSLAGQAT